LKTKKLRSIYPNIREAIRDIATVVNNEPTFELTLETGTAVTTISNPLIGKDSFIGFMPTSSTAAAELASMYVSSRGKYTFDLTHSTAAAADRTFTYFVQG
jgi:hypothetical protein